MIPRHRRALGVLMALLPAPALLAQIPVITRGPYLQNATPDAITIRWRTDIASSSRIAFGAAPELLLDELTSAMPTTEHELRLTGLTAETMYFYAVGTMTELLAGGDALHQFVTSPPPGQDRPVRLWVIGDSGRTTQAAFDVHTSYMAFAGARRTDVWLMLGDNAYNIGTDAEYQAAVFDKHTDLLPQTPLWPTYGNHDGFSADSATQTGPYYDIFTLPTEGEAGGMPSGTEAYYSFDFANIHFICLDSEDTSRAANGAMMTWLAADVADTTADWVIAFWHHPPYSKGSHDSDNIFDSTGRMFDMREIALPILEDAGVDLVLTGHSHSYERSFLLDSHYGASDTLLPSMILDGGDGWVGGDGAYAKATAGPTPHEGAVHVVAGASGNLSAGTLDHPVMQVSFLIMGSLVIDVDGNKLWGLYLDNQGQVQDRFMLVKGGIRPGDIDQSAHVNVSDLLDLLAAWGQCDACAEDIDRSGDVGVSDLLILLAQWG